MNLVALTLSSALMSTAAFAAEVAPQIQNQTVVLIRHGEKPAAGLGQLACQGLNRSLALPTVMMKKFDKPLAIFAPNPARRAEDHGQSYNYVRPLATIEPAAIAFGLPVNVDYDVLDLKGLEIALEQPSFANGTVLVAWEHKLISRIAQDIVTNFGGDVSVVPKKWEDDDFDRIYVLRITRSATTASAVFQQDQEGLDGQSPTCPIR